MATPLTAEARRSAIDAAQQELVALHGDQSFKSAVISVWTTLQPDMHRCQSLEEVQGYARGAVKALQSTSNVIFSTTIKNLMHVYVGGMSKQLGVENPLSRGF